MTRPRRQRLRSCVLGLSVVCLCGITSAQTTTAPGIDVEIHDPLDGGNSFCAVPNVAFWAHLFVRPGDESLSCDRTCGNNIPGGSASIATALIDITFDTSLLSVQSFQSNPDPTYAAVDGIPQLQNLDTGRIGWALEGDWIVDGDPSSGFNDPCVMQKVQSEGWVFRVQFIAASEGTTSLHLRRQTDPAPFELSFADICGSDAYTVINDGIDEVVDAVVTIGWACCSYSIDPTSEMYGPSGGSGSVTVNAQGECPWNAASDVGWVTVTSGSTGTGTGAVTYDVSANTSPDPRTGTLTVAGQTFMINQEGITCAYSIDPTSASYDASGGSGSIAVTTQAGCDWEASSNVGWATVISGSPGSGNGTVTYNVSANSSPDPRTGTLTVAGQTFTINQEGSGPDVFEDGFESGDTSAWSATVP